jgi:hypothetical protein
MSDHGTVLNVNSSTSMLSFDREEGKDDFLNNNGLVIFLMQSNLFKKFRMGT